MKQRYENYRISNGNLDLEYLNEDFKGDWDLNRKMMKKERDEEGVDFYIFKEEENRIELTCLDPEGNGFKSVLTRVA